MPLKGKNNPLTEITGPYGESTPVDCDNFANPEELLEGYQRQITKLTTIISGMHEGILYANSQDMITEVNPWFLKLVELEKEQIIGKYLYDLAIFRAFPELGNIIQNFEELPDSGQTVLEHQINNRFYEFHVQPLYQESAYHGVIINIIDITQLVIARTQAESSSRIKSEFLAMMSHEIRTPMNSIIGFSELLMESNLENDQMDYIHTILDNGHTLLSIIDDILDFSKIESGKFKIEMVSVNPMQIFEQLRCMFEPIAEKKKLQYQLNILNKIPETIQADPTRLKQCLINLINNAMKFTSEGSICLNVSMCDIDGLECICLDVKDTGVGIEPDKQELIFECFTQADNSTTREYGGTGLGLSITKKLVELMGGCLEVESSPGNGSTFSIQLPVCRG